MGFKNDKVLAAGTFSVSLEPSLQLPTPLIAHLQLRNNINKQIQVIFEAPGSTGGVVLRVSLTEAL